jgi:transcriptional regulator with XRE-family HTH domain
MNLGGKIMKDLEKKIGNRIKELREKQGLTMEKLAYESGVSKGGLSEIERGMKEPRISTILCICNNLEISMSEFFSYLK